jgi:hypothetical protein
MKDLEERIKKLEENIQIKDKLLNEATDRAERLDLEYKQLLNKEKQRADLLKSATGGQYIELDSFLGKIKKDINLKKVTNKVSEILPQEGTDPKVKENLINYLDEINRKSDAELNYYKKQAQKEANLSKNRIKKMFGITETQFNKARAIIIDESNGAITEERFNELLDAPMMDERIRAVLDLNEEELAYNKARKIREEKERLKNTSIRAGGTQQTETLVNEEKTEKQKLDEEAKSKTTKLATISNLKETLKNANFLLLRLNNFLTGTTIKNAKGIDAQNNALREWVAARGLSEPYYQDIAKLREKKLLVEKDIADMKRVLAELENKGV